MPISLRIALSTGKLELIVQGPGAPYDGAHYRDTQTLTVESKLPELFRAIEIHKLRADWDEQERQRKQAERRLRWEAAMNEAKVDFTRQARWEHFKECSRTWHQITQHRAFLAAARAAAAAHQGSERPTLIDQLDVAAATLEALDPIIHAELMIPAIAEPTLKDLEPFLHDWSPLGPDGHR